jgi:hypothetical protein
VSYNSKLLSQKRHLLCCNKVWKQKVRGKLLRIGAIMQWILDDITRHV